MSANNKIVISGAPGTGKSTIGGLIAEQFSFPLLSLDAIKETLGDRLGPGDEDWSDLLGDTAAEIIFGLSATSPNVVVEGWWRGERRERAVKEFDGWIEVFCRCEPALAETRMRVRHDEGRHPIHRDVINPALLDRAAHLAETVVPLGVGPLIEVDTTVEFDPDRVLSDVRGALNQG